MSTAHPIGELTGTLATSPTRLADDAGRWTTRVRPAWAALREVIPAKLREHLTDALARQIVKDHRDDRRLQFGTVRSVKTEADYRNIYYQRLCRFANAQQEHFDIVEETYSFISRADLTATSWDNYRTAYIFTLSEMVDEEAATHGGERFDTAMALALLLIVDGQPANNQSREEIKTVSQADLETITDVIDATRSRSQSHRQRQVWPDRVGTALRATMATGLRPAEWQNARVGPARPDMIPTALPSDRIGAALAPAIFAIEVLNAKRKAYQADSSRTLLLRDGPEVHAVLQHLYNLRMIVPEDANAARVTQLHSVFHDRCSRMLREACQEAWPEAPERWISLKTLRFQVAANCKRRFGKAIAALMMGHAPSVGRSSYPGPEASWDPTDHSFSEWSVHPSAELVARAKARGIRRSGADRVSFIENPTPAIVASTPLSNELTDETADVDDAIDGIDQLRWPS